MACKDVLAVTQLIQPGKSTQKNPEPTDAFTKELEPEVKLTNGYTTSGSEQEESQETYDQDDSRQVQKQVEHLAVVSCDSFANAKPSYDQHAETTGFAGFYDEVFPLQSRLVVQYVVNAFASSARLPMVSHQTTNY